MGGNLSAASMIATHLNTPYGKIVCEQDVIDSLRNGHFSATTEPANAILSALFLEILPELIYRCAREIGASQEAIFQLYQQSVLLTGLPCREWEQDQQ